MLHYPKIDPVAVHLGPIQIHWYGIMYVVGFAVAWWLARRQAWRAPKPRYTRGVLAKFAFNASSASSGAVLDHFE